MSQNQTVDLRASKLANYLSWLCLGLLCLLPAHAFFTTWLGSQFGHLDVWRIWKEIIIVVLVSGCLALLALQKSARTLFTKDYLTWLILAYIGLQIITGLAALAAGRVNGDALIYGWFADGRYLILFLVVQLLVGQSTVLPQRWRQVLFYPAAVVIGFGLFQLVLPADFLKHFGYGSGTILPYQAVDLKPDFVRLQSIMRGPNPLGAYLVLILTGALAGFMWAKRRVWYASLLTAGSIVLFFTYSRSAYLGFLVSAGLLLLIALRASSSKRRKQLAFGAAVVAVTLISGVLAFGSTRFVQNTLLHTDETSVSPQSSNAARRNALVQNTQDVLRHPLGQGPGTAGLASVRNNRPKIAENYFVQIAQEVGIVGLGLLLAIFGVVTWRLWLLKSESLAAILLASFVGLFVVNMVSHAWADDTLGLLWWGLAGIALAQPAILKHKNHGKKAYQKT